MGRHKSVIEKGKQTPGQAASAARKRRNQARNKAALEEEAERRGLTVSELVQEKTLVTKKMIEEARNRELQERLKREKRREYYSGLY
ncbi:MAG: hypothetical protein U5L76_05170 [Patescibacteria group bacterium]|nr:hypothetical protein [Patescibacteria group bacterium]